ncbi:MAG TPA: M23 family metallopeptidase [bacterium]|nr:M23 family metallopeptidase [bacterium]
MKKTFSWLIAALLILAQAPAFANIPSADEEGGVVEFELSSAPNFFLEDANDLSPSLEATLPDMMPCDGVVTSDFGWRRVSRRRGRMHLGVDIAAPYGSTIVAPADGRVAFVGRKGGYGLTVVLEHGGNLTTLFAHNSEIFVKEGDSVRRGQSISAIGMSGHSTGPHVHYEVRIDGNAVNPGKYL